GPETEEFLRTAYQDIPLVVRRSATSSCRKGYARRTVNADEECQTRTGYDCSTKRRSTCRFRPRGRGGSRRRTTRTRRRPEAWHGEWVELTCGVSDQQRHRTPRSPCRLLAWRRAPRGFSSDPPDVPEHELTLNDPGDVAPAGSA